MDRGTLHEWWQQGKVKPVWVTPGGATRQGHARWDIEDLKRQLGITRRIEE